MDTPNTTKPVSEGVFAPKNSIALIPLLISIAIFCAAAWWQSDSHGSWHEEISVYPSPAYSIVARSSNSTESPPFMEQGCSANGISTIVSQERPNLSLCFYGRIYPIMVMPYGAGYIYWPSSLLQFWHQDDVFRLRKLNMAVGTITLIGLWLLLDRLSTRLLANSAVFIVATSPPYIFLHSLLVSYEIFPFFFLLGGMLTLSHLTSLSPTSKTSGPPTLPLLLSSLCIGLSLAANLKSILMIIPLIGVSVLFGVRWTIITKRQWFLAFLTLVIPLIPTVAFALLDPSSGFNQQFRMRSQIAQSSSFLNLFAEPWNTALFWSDVIAYFDEIAGIAPSRNLPAMILACISFLWAVVSLIRWRTVKNPIGAAGAALLLVFLFVSTFLYRQYPPANYSPINAVFGVVTAGAVIWLGQSVEQRFSVLRNRITPLLIVGAGLLFASNVIRRGDARSRIDLPTNAAAETRATKYLIDHLNDNVTLFTTTYNLAGVFESLSHGKLKPIQAHGYLLRSCSNEKAPELVRPCLLDRWEQLLSSNTWPLPFRFVGPAKYVRIDESGSKFLWETLHQAAEKTGMRVTLETGIRASGTDDALMIFRVEKDPNAPVRAPTAVVPSPQVATSTQHQETPTLPSNSGNSGNRNPNTAPPAQPQEDNIDLILAAIGTVWVFAMITIIVIRRRQAALTTSTTHAAKQSEKSPPNNLEVMRVALRPEV